MMSALSQRSHVCFTLESGHVRCNGPCLLGASEAASASAATAKAKQGARIRRNGDPNIEVYEC